MPNFDLERNIEAKSQGSACSRSIEGAQHRGSYICAKFGHRHRVVVAASAGDAVGRVIHFHQAWGSDNSAGHPDCRSNRDCGLILLLIMHWRGLRLPANAATWRRFMFQACLNSVVPWTLIAWAERSVDAGLATILNSTSPIFTFFLTLAVAHREAASPRKLFGVAIGMAGICLIVGVQAFESLGQALVAQLAIVAATICYAGAAVFGRGFNRLDPIVPAAGSLLCGAERSSSFP